MTDAELVTSILTDPTLRRGDIVEFPDGPRMYRGNGRFSSHRVIDFEDVREAGLVGFADRRTGRISTGATLESQIGQDLGAPPGRR